MQSPHQWYQVADVCDVREKAGWFYGLSEHTGSWQIKQRLGV